MMLRLAPTSLRPVLQARTFHVASCLRARSKTEAPKVESVLSKLSVQSERIKRYKPVTPGLRHLRRPISPHLFEGRPIRSLTIPKRKTGGRNAQGKITVRHIGGGHKQRIRILDFMRLESGPQDVVRIEYDPGRSAHIALLKSRIPNSRKPFAYIVAPDGLRAGDVVQSYRRGIPDGLVPGYEDKKAPTRRERREARQAALAPPPSATSADGSSGFEAPTNPYALPNTDPSAPQSVLDPSILRAASAQASLRSSSSSSTPTSGPGSSHHLGLLRTLTIHPGNVLPLRLIPSGTMIHCTALSPQGPALLCRSAGTFAQVVAHDDKAKYTQVRLQSGEVRNVLQNCVATVGKVSNPDWKLRQLGKAGRARWLGRRPSVRGMAMNACDHPHGGGRGKSKGNKAPRSVWGWVKGKRTRRPGDKDGNKMVVHQRPRGKEKRKSA